MSWGVNLDEVAAARDALREEVAEHARSHPLERLANAHRWLDEEDEARRRFGEAAADLEASFEARGRGDALSRGRTGGLLLQAKAVANS